MDPSFPQPPPLADAPRPLPLDGATPIRASARGPRIAFAILFAVAFALFAYVVSPFGAPLLLAVVLASVLHGLFDRLAHLLRGRRAIAAALMTLGLLVALFGPMAALLAFASGQVVLGLAYLRDQLGLHSVTQLAHGGLPPRAAALFDHGLAALHLSRAQVSDLAGRAATFAEGETQSILAGSGRALFHLFITLIAFYFLLLEGSRLLRWLRDMSPLEARQTHDLLEEFRNVSRASILGAVLSALFQGTVAAIGFAVTSVPHAVFFGLATLFASFIPVVGTLLVWAPATVLLWLFGHHAAAIVLLAWSVVFIMGAEHLGKPWLLRTILGGQGEMHTGLVFLSLLGGIEVFGLIGLVLGPMVMAFFLAMTRIYLRDFRGTPTLPH